MEQSLKDLLVEMIEHGESEGYAVRTNYSGRAMYGQQCIGVDGEHPVLFIIECMENLVDMEPEYALAYFQLLKMQRQDSMGLGTIIYFPSWAIETEEDKKFFAELTADNDQGD